MSHIKTGHPGLDLVTSLFIFPRHLTLFTGSNYIVSVWEIEEQQCNFIGTNYTLLTLHKPKY